MIPLALFGVGLLVRFVVGAAFPGPAYPDSYYYAHVAQQLAAGHGFVADYIWNLDDVGRSIVGASSLPVAANGFWTPLAEIVQLPFLWLFGASGTSVAFWILGALCAPVAFFIGRDAGLEKRDAVAVGLMAAVPAGLLPFVAQPDNFALTMLLGALALWLAARAWRGDRRAFVVGALVVALATLARADGVLLGIPFAWIALRDLSRRKLDVRAVAAAAVVFAVVLAPWLLRQMEVYGTPFPAAGGRLVFLTDYQQLFSATNPPTFDGWLGQGPLEIVLGRVRGLIAAVGVFALLPLVVVLVPFTIVGAWLRRRDSWFAPFFIYVVALLGANALLFPVLVPHGTFLHAVAAVVPHTFVLVIIGVRGAVQWVAARRSTWNPATATPVFVAAAVAVAFVGAGIETLNVTREWKEARVRSEAVAASLSGAPPADRFMAADPGAINYLTGRQGVVTVDDPLPVIEGVMRSYDVRWLVLESADLVPAFKPVLSGDVRPAWLSRPVAVIPGAPSAVATTGPAVSTVPSAALYAVCFAPDDVRCQ
jgi:hypothetical protein